MANIKIIEKDQIENWFMCNFSNSVVYVRDANVKLSSYAHGQYGRDNITVTHLAGALTRGKMCSRTSFSANEQAPIEAMLKKYNFDIAKILSAADDVEKPENKYGQVSFEGVNMSRSADQGVRVFSPFNMDKIKPLKTIPKKWNVTNVVKLLLNNQFKDLRTSARYTDDYAYDAAYNYGKGEFDALEMAIMLIETPSGWWFSDGEEDGGALGLSCHSFDYKYCTIDLKGNKDQPKLQVEDLNVKPEAIEAQKANNIIPFPQNHSVQKAGILI